MDLTPRDVTRRRLAAQFLTTPGPATAAEVVRALGAVQSQDYAGAKWAVGQRTAGATDADVERELNEGRILRTHVLRPTWHFVAPSDIRWMLALSAPRQKAAMTYYDRLLELTPDVYRKSNAAIEKALVSGTHLTRAELARAIRRAGVKIATGQQLGHLVFGAERDALICSGSRRGKQFTYALLEERVQPVPALDRDEALAKLARTYFTTRGPATVRDFAWWSGLALKDAKRGLEIVAADLERAGDFWFATAQLPRARPSAHLLPNYDEYFIGHKDRSAIAQRLGDTEVVSTSNVFAHGVFVDGQLVGWWKRSAASPDVELQVLARLTRAERARVDAVVRDFARFTAGANKHAKRASRKRASRSR